MANSTAILPKDRRFDMRKVIQNTLTAQAKAIKVDFALPAATWEHKVSVAISSPSPFVREITVDDEIYAMLNAGTRAHEIRKKGRGILRFKFGFQSKTLPNQIMSRSGNKGTVPAPPLRVVQHPGTAARNWDRVIGKKWQERIGDIFQRAIDSAVH